MVVRIVDVNKYKGSGRNGIVHVEVVCEVMHEIAGTVFTEIVELMGFDEEILVNDDAFVNSIRQRIRTLYPPHDLKKYVGMEIPIDGR